MAISLKISNIIGNELELIQRIKKVKTPVMNNVLKALASNDYKTVFYELLYRIELFCETKVLNYTRQDLNTIVTSSRKVGIDKIVNELYKKYQPEIQQQEIQQAELDNEVVIESLSTISPELKKYILILIRINKDILEGGVEGNYVPLTAENSDYYLDQLDNLEASAKILAEFSDWIDDQLEDVVILNESQDQLTDLNEIGFMSDFEEASADSSEEYLNLDEAFKEVFECDNDSIIE